MKTFRRILASFMVAVTVLTVAPLTGFVGLELPNVFEVFASAESYSGTCGENLTWTFDESTGELSIGGTGDMNDYGPYNSPWESYKEKIVTLTIGTGVSSIGNNSFNKCKSLTKAVIGDSVTTIGEEAFWGCESLVDVETGDTVTVIGNLAFSYCYNLKKITIPDGVTEIGNDAFAWCESLANIELPDSLKTIGGGAFSYCESLSKITIPASVTVIGDMAFMCNSLESFTVAADNAVYSSLDGVLFNKKKTILIQYPLNSSRTSYTIPHGVEEIEYGAFAYCETLSNVIIPDSVTDIQSYAFGYCNSLSRITIPDSVTWMADAAFGCCESLKNVTIGDGLQIIPPYAFTGCISLLSVEIGKSVSALGDGAFRDCYSLTDFIVSEDNLSYSSMDGVWFNKDKTKIVIYPMGNKRTSYTIPGSVTEISKGAFAGSTYLTDIIIPDSIEAIGEGAFAKTGYYNDLTNWENGVLYIGKYLIEADDELSGDYTIKDGTRLIADYAFSYCELITGVTIPDSVTVIGNSAFYMCKSLTNIKISDNIASMGKYAFLGSGYENDPANWENNVLYIGKYLIDAKSELTGDYSVKDGTKLIAAEVFRSCKSLNSIAIPKSVMLIGDYAFSNCTNLSDVYYDGTESEWNNIVIGVYNSSLVKATIHFNDGSVSTHTHNFVFDLHYPEFCLALYKCSCGDTETETMHTDVDSDNICDVCGEAVVHICSYSASVTKQATCTEEGIMTYTCSYCGDAYTESIPARGHTGDWEIVLNPTNTETGLMVRKCEVCGATAEEKIIPANTTVGFCGDNTFYVFNESTGTLIISGMDEIYYIESEAPWSEFKDRIKSIVIEEGVTEVKHNAFSGCENLENVTIGNSVTTIGSGAFSNCTSLNSISLPSDLKCVSRSLFEGCSELKTVVLNGKIEYIDDYAFNDCVNLTSVSIPETVIKIGYYAFENCINLTDVSIPETVTQIGYGAFKGCKSVTSITLPGVSYIEDGAFAECEKLKEVSFTENLKSIEGGAFEDCVSLESIYLPASLEKIDEYAFKGCLNLSSVNIAEGSKLIYVGGRAFSDTAWINDDSNYIEGFLVLNDCLIKVNENYTGICYLPSGITYISEKTFENCDDITIIIVPEGVTEIEYQSIYGATKLIAIYLPATLEKIDNWNLDRPNNLFHVLYAGTQEMWDSIYIGSSGNSGLLNATKHYDISNEVISFTVTQEPTCTDTGKAMYSCAVCGSQKEVSVKELGHNFINNSCVNCDMFVKPLNVFDCSSVTVDEPGKLVYFSFIPVTSGTYCFFSDAQQDTYGYVYDERFIQLASNDDSGDDSNFLVSYEFVAGEQYYLGARFYSSDATGEFYVVLSDSYVSSHNYVVSEIVEPTCTEYGYTVYTCIYCGDTYTDDYIEPSHKSASVLEVVEPVCGQRDGYTIYYCSDCNEEYYDDWVWIDHTKGDVIQVVEPVCGRKEGYTVYNCSNCGEVFNSDWVWLSHNKNQVMKTVDPICGEEFGYTKYRCSCGTMFNDDYIWIDHTDELVETTEATCTKASYNIYVCTECGAKSTYRDSDALGHTLKNGQCTRCEFVVAELKLNELADVNINDECEIVYFAFRPEKDGVYYFYSDSNADTYGYLYDSEMNELVSCDDYDDNNFVIEYTLSAGQMYYLSARYYSDDYTGSFKVKVSDEFTSNHCYELVETVAATCRSEGYDYRKCSVCGKENMDNYVDPTGHNYVEGLCDNCGCHENNHMFDVKPYENSTLVIDEDNKMIYGIPAGLNRYELRENYLSVCDEIYMSLSTSIIGTGTIVSFKTNGETAAQYTILVFGDVNGDGWYDGTDSIIVSCLANGMLTKDDVSEAVYMAADCNHDGVIDDKDVELLNQAGTLLANVDQTNPAEVLLETSSEYVEYLGLIDQSHKIEVEDNTETDVEPDAPESGDAEEEGAHKEDTEDSTQQDAKVDIWEMILNFIKLIFEMLLAYILVPIK